MPGKLLIVVLGLACLGAWFLPDRAARLPASASAGEPKKKELTKLYFGVSLCRKCHNEKEPVPDKSALLYRGTEMHTWDKFDKHKDATIVLKGPLGQQMAQRLGIKGDITQERQCISCHGVLTGPGDAIDESFKDAADREASGVSCVVCHGPHPAWVNEHVKIIGGAWGSASAEFNEIRHRTDVVGGVLASVHTDLEFPIGCCCCVFYTGFRLEWSYIWGDILQRKSDIEEINLLFTLGVRF